MQCQDCTALTHRLSSQLEKKKERERARGNSKGGGLWRATKDCTTPGWERGAPSGRPARAARRRAGTSSTTSSAQLSRVGLSASRPGTAHFLRPNKAGEGVFKPPAAARAGDFQQTSPPLQSQSPPSPSPGTLPPDGFAGINRPRGSFLSHQGQEETVTKCLETHRACQESLCVMLGRTQVAFFHKENSSFGYAKSLSPLFLFPSPPEEGSESLRIEVLRHAGPQIEAGLPGLLARGSVQSLFCFFHLS
ncbi:unnamed protein product, partial [Rangifer tarandus platyrhynchus]